MCQAQNIVRDVFIGSGEVVNICTIKNSWVLKKLFDLLVPDSQVFLPYIIWSVE